MVRRKRNASSTSGRTRKGHGFRQAGRSAKGSLKNIAGKQGFAVADILVRWPEIAGPEMSQICHPVKVTYSTSRQLGATLVVQTNSGHAPQIEHQASELINRVNQFYGYRAISRMKVTQSTGLGVARGFSEDQSGFAGPDTEPTRQDSEKAATLAQDIEHPGLRTALSQMGAHILAQSRSQPKND